MKFLQGLLFITFVYSQRVTNDSEVVESEQQMYESEQTAVVTKNDWEPQEYPEQDLATDELIFRKDVVIDSSQVATQSIRIIGGDLTVYGTVKGKITLYGGDAYLKEGAVIDGEIITVGGYVYRDPGAIIRGKIVESNLTEGLIYRETDQESDIQGHSYFDWDGKGTKSHRDWIHPEKHMFIYNRNEGVVFTPFNEFWDGRSHSSFRFSWSLGVRLNKGMTPGFTGRATFEKTFFKNKDLILFTSGFRESRTDDYYRLPALENSLAAFFGRQDFYDRWDETGWEVGLGLDLNLLKLKLKATSAELDTLPVVNLWSLFERERTLRPNLTVPNKQLGYYQGILAFRTLNYEALASGVALMLQAEYYQAPEEERNFLDIPIQELRQRHLGIAIVNWEFSYGLVLRNRFIVGIASNELDPYRYFGVGGLGSVSATPYKHQIGNRMLQWNLEFVMTPDFTASDWVVKAFLDAGHAWKTSDYGYDWNKIKNNGISSVGFGFGEGDEGESDLDWMVNIAKPLDRGDYIETTIRINYNF